MDDLASYSQYLELVAAIIGTVKYGAFKNSKLKYVLFFLWYVVFTDFFAGISYPWFDIPNYIVYNLYYLAVFAFFLLWCRSLLSSRVKKAMLLFFFCIYCLFYLVNIIFLQDFVFDFLTYSFTVGTMLITITVSIYFVEMLNRDIILQVTKSSYFWISFGLLVFCITYLPFKLAYRFMEGENYILKSLVLFLINCIQYTCFAIAFIKAKKGSMDHPILNNE